MLVDATKKRMVALRPLIARWLHTFLDASNVVTTETWKSQENIPMVQAVQSHQSCSAEMLRMEHDDEITIRSVEQ